MARTTRQQLVRHHEQLQNGIDNVLTTLAKMKTLYAEHGEHYKAQMDFCDGSAEGLIHLQQAWLDFRQQYM